MTSVDLKPGTAGWRSFHFHPADPISVCSSAKIEEVRRCLAAWNPRISIWWSSTRKMWDYQKDQPAELPGRWRIVEWMPNRENWETSFYWEGPNGEYRDPVPVTAILERLARADVPTNVASAKAEDAAQKREATRKKELTEACDELDEDLRARHLGIRQTFAPGYIRRREVKRSDLKDTNHQRFLRAHAKKWSGSQ